MADRVISGKTRRRKRAGALAHAARAPISVPSENPMIVATSSNPIVHGMALAIIRPTRAG